MNQILSVEMPKNKSKYNPSGPSNKASIKSVTLFFAIALIILGIAIVGVAIYSISTKNNNPSITPNIQAGLPKIDVTQNATELEIEISSNSEIESVKYFWEEQDEHEVKGDGKNSISFTIDIPSGNNIITINATDVNGKTNEYSKEYVGAKEPNITSFAPKFDTKTGKNKISIGCEENQVIKFISYSYDDNNENTLQINDTKAVIEIDALEGKHELSIKVGYADGTVGKISKNVYFPIINIKTDGTGTNYTKFIFEVTDLKTIEKAVINFNGTETVEQVNQNTYLKELQLKPGQPGTNKVIITIYNEDGMSITKRVWDINRQN